LLLSILATVSASRLRFSRDLTRLAPADIPPATADRSIASGFSRARHRWIVLLQGDSLQQVLRVNDRLADLLARLQRQRRIAGYGSLAGVLPARQTQRIRRERLARLHPQRVVQNVKNALAAVDLEPQAFDAFYQSLLDPRELGLEDLPPSMMPLVMRQLARRGSRVMVATVLHPLPRSDPASIGRSLRSLATDGVKIRLTGADLAGEQMALLLRGDLLLVGALCLAVVVVVLALLLRDLRPVAACLVSLVVSAMVFLGTMSLFGIDLDLYNLMVVPILVGYGVDDHIYVVRRAVVDGIGRAVTDSGRAVLATTLTSMAAFGALGLCSLPGLRALGLTAALGLVICLVGSLVILPALVAILCPGGRTGYTIAP
jgi:predicted RND superfamily exporter protein